MRSQNSELGRSPLVNTRYSAFSGNPALMQIERFEAARPNRRKSSKSSQFRNPSSDPYTTNDMLSPLLPEVSIGPSDFSRAQNRPHQRGPQCEIVEQTPN